MGSIRCLVLSDSHGRTDRLTAAIKRAGKIDALFFLGDGLADLATAISATPPFAVLAVKGNCDFGNPIPDRNVYKVDSITLAERKIVFTHGDIYGAKYGLDGLISLANNMTADIVLYGHTHEPREDYIDGRYYFNPGSLKGDRALPTAGILVQIEFDIFNSLRQLVAENNERLRTVASIIAELDVYRSFGEVADKNNYVCPEVDMSFDLIIKDGRHPVVEKFVSDSYFVPNDTCLDVSANKVMIITGPNMAGKSTYMRQVAIITIMAQIGSFVPAREARIGIVDKLFTRVGASDDLASGQSTFMLEMNEVATILKNATKRSLIIYDEVGRGTSTFDGMAIARAVVEYTYSKKIGAKTLFATHYHELTDMEDEFPGIVNYNIAAKKRGDSITFLRKIVRGGTDDSYGIEVAKLAGVPNEVVKRAKEILKDIESGAVRTVVASRSDEREPDIFSTLLASRDSEVADKIRTVDLNTLTPIEAMNFLFEIKKMLDE